MTTTSAAKVRAKLRRETTCSLCLGEGFVHTEWFGLKPLPWSAAECPECGGRGRVVEEVEESLEESPPWRPEELALWVRAYREARRRGLSPEEARDAADGEVGEELPF